jgi:predicted CoA-binding protein
MAQVVAVIGASSDRTRYANKAVRAYARQGFTVVPVHPRETEVEGFTVYRSVLDVPGHVDLASLYLPPAAGEQVIEEIAQKGIPEVWVNPGADSPALVARAKALGIRTIVACSIIGLGENPNEL